MSERNELNIELLSIVGLNPWIGNNSGAREYMFTSHIGQHLLIKGANEKRVQTGMEIEFAKYTFNSSIPVDANVIKIIQKYPKTLSNDIKHNTKVTVIYEDVDSKKIDVLDIPLYKSYHQSFGYMLKENPIMASMHPGMFIPKGTVLADSPAVSDVGGYMFGIELNAAFTSHPAAADDGILICEDVLPRLAFNKIETRVIEFGQDNFPLNIYGDDTNYKPFPDIGEYLREDGILSVLRRYDDILSPALMGKDDVRKIDHVFDDCIYVNNPKARVLDINVIYNKTTEGGLPNGIEKQLEKYITASRLYYNSLLDTEREIWKNRHSKYGITKLDLGPALHRLLYEANVMTNDGGDRANDVIKKLYRKSPIDIYRVEITVEYEVTPNHGFKLSGQHGNKGVICYIEKPENMPVDKNGVRADIVADDISTINRMNLGRAFEHYMGSACNHIEFMLREHFGLERFKKYELDDIINHIKDKNIALARNKLIRFYSMVNDGQGLYFSDLPEEQFIEHLASVIQKGPYLYLPPDTQKEHADIVREIEREFKPLYDRVYIRDENGNQVETEDKIRIAPVYMMLLEKVADTWSAISSGKLQHFGVLSPSNRSEKYAYPFKNTAVRAVGETEGRIYASYTSKLNVAEVMDRNNNPHAHREVVKSIINADKPGYIENAVDRSLVEFGGNKPNQIVNHIALCSGWKFSYFNSEKEQS